MKFKLCSPTKPDFAAWKRAISHDMPQGAGFPVFF